MARHTQAPVVIVKGNLKIFVNDCTFLGETIRAFDSFALQSRDRIDSASEFISSTAADIMQEVADKLQKPIKSLRDAIYETRRVLPPKLSKQIQALNTTHSFLRHNTRLDCEELVKQMREAKLDDKGYDSFVNTEQPTPHLNDNERIAKQHKEANANMQAQPENDGKVFHFDHCRQNNSCCCFNEFEGLLTKSTNQMLGKLDMTLKKQEGARMSEHQTDTS